MTHQGIFLRAPAAADATEATIDVVGVIGWDVGFKQLREVLAAIPASVTRVVFDIYSPGGDVWDGNAIIHEIGQMPQETVARVRVAASMATLIAVACKRREMSANGRWLIHNPWTATQGDAEEFEKRAKELRDAETEAAEFYARRTGKTADEMRALMAEERWLTPVESQGFGFVHEIVDPFDAAAFAPIREAITAAGRWPSALAELPEVTDVHATPGGSAQPAPEVGDPAPAPAVSTADDLVAMLRAEYDRGHADASAVAATAAAELIRAHDAQQVDVIRATQAALEALKASADEAAKAAAAKLSESEARAAKHQSERDRALDDLRRVREALDQAKARLAKHLGGALTFAPAVETWEEALRSCGGDYAQAATKFPELLKVYRAKHAHK